MDATQKKRIRKVAIIHFALSVLFGLVVIVVAPALNTDHSPSPAESAFVVWSYFFIAVFFIFQPQYLVLAIVSFTDAKEFIPYGLDGFLGIILPLVVAPFWSYNFARLFVKLDNWLNHFPVLGKRVF